MKFAVIGYAPPPSYGNPAAFLANVRQFKCGSDLLIYSEYPWPDTIRLKGSPEILRGVQFPDGKTENKFGVANAAFFTGVRIAYQQGYTHVIALEEDCRVGCHEWDQKIIEEYMDVGRPLVAAGSLVCYNACNDSPEATRRWQELLRRNTRRNFPIPTYGFTGAGQRGRCCIFPNGALAVYDVRWLCSFFDIAGDAIAAAAREDAWDMAIGWKIWEKFGVESYDVTAMLDCIWSGYGNLVTSEDERKHMLTSGQVVAVHQIKTPWKP